MRRLQRLPAAKRWLLIEAALLLEVVKLGMMLLPFTTLRRLLGRAAGVLIEPRRADHPSADEVVWAVEVASQYTPGAKTCLARALAVQVLLVRRGQPALLRIGVLKTEQEQFRAHAWVETEGKVVIGGSETGRYAPLATLEVKDPENYGTSSL